MRRKEPDHTAALFPVHLKRRCFLIKGLPCLTLRAMSRRAHPEYLLCHKLRVRVWSFGVPYFTIELEKTAIGFSMECHLLWYSIKTSVFLWKVPGQNFKALLRHRALKHGAKGSLGEPVVESKIDTVMLDMEFYIRYQAD